MLKGTFLGKKDIFKKMWGNNREKALVTFGNHLKYTVQRSPRPIYVETHFCDHDALDMGKYKQSCLGREFVLLLKLNYYCY